MAAENFSLYDTVKCLADSFAYDEMPIRQFFSYRLDNELNTFAVSFELTDVHKLV